MVYQADLIIKCEEHKPTVIHISLFKGEAAGNQSTGLQCAALHDGENVPHIAQLVHRIAM